MSSNSAAARPRSVLIVDPSPLVGDALGAMVARELDTEAVTKVATLARARAAAGSADLVITDLDLPDAERFDVVPVLTEHAPGTPLLVVTERGSSADVERAVRSGATGYVLKSTDTDTFFRALRSVAAGRPFLQAELGASLYGPARAEADQRPGNLTDAELRLLDLLARGFTNRQAADAELVSLRTIESRRARLQEKLECEGRAALTRHARPDGDRPQRLADAAADRQRIRDGSVVDGEHRERSDVAESDVVVVAQTRDVKDESRRPRSRRRVSSRSRHARDTAAVCGRGGLLLSLSEPPACRTSMSTAHRLLRTLCMSVSARPRHVQASRARPGARAARPEGVPFESARQRRSEC